MSTFGIHQPLRESTKEWSIAYPLPTTGDPDEQLVNVVDEDGVVYEQVPRFLALALIKRHNDTL